MFKGKSILRRVGVLEHVHCPSILAYNTFEIFKGKINIFFVRGGWGVERDGYQRHIHQTLGPKQL